LAEQEINRYIEDIDKVNKLIMETRDKTLDKDK